jgi:hypothetical protein
VSNSDQLLLLICAIMMIIVGRNRKAVSADQNLDDETLVPGMVNVTRRYEMRSFWERIGVLGPIYRSLGVGLNDDNIAMKLNLPGEKVQNCIAWMLRFLKLKNRQKLVLYSSTAA